MCRFVVLVLSIFSVVLGDIAITVNARKDLQLTVYRDFGVVRDIRKINVPEGGNRIRFEGVATGINAESVNLDWASGAGIELIGQSYEFDLVSPQKLMEKYVGREIEIVPSKNLWPDTTIQTAELISINGKEPVYRIGTKITFGDIGRVLFPYMPDNLYTMPTLVWNVYIQKRKETEIAANYLTDGLSWNAAYMLQVDKKDASGSFGGWITFNNESGLDCKNAQITFVAGDVRRIRVKTPTTFTVPGAMDNLQRYGDYFFYTMNQRVTILSNHSKQVEWIPRGAVKLKKSYFAEVSVLPSSSTTPRVYSAVQLVNNESNGLGFPLPDGIIRVFKKDATDQYRFIGESRIGETPSGGAFIVPVGKSDGIAVMQRNLSSDSYSVEVKNKKKGTVSVNLHMVARKYDVVNSSKKFRKIDDGSLEWDITLKSGGTEKITYSTRYRK